MDGDGGGGGGGGGSFPPLAKASPDAILVMVSNPVNVLTFVAWKGFLVNRVLGSGTNLHSSRFGFLRADHLDVNAQDIQLSAFIVGEHGDSSVALWSSISVGGIPVLNFLEEKQIFYKKQTLEDIHQSVVNSSYEVIGLKGNTSWAIGYLLLNWLAQSFVTNASSTLLQSLLVDGGDVFLSVPTLLGSNGVVAVTKVHMTDEETKKLQKSAKTILEMQSQLRL